MYAGAEPIIDLVLSKEQTGFLRGKLIVNQVFG